VIIENLEEMSLLNCSCFSKEKETQQNKFEENIIQDSTIINNQDIEMLKNSLEQSNQ
jgi:hypothetical protein